MLEGRVVEGRKRKEGGEIKRREEDYGVFIDV